MKNAPFFVAQKTGMKLALSIKKLGVNILVGLLVVTHGRFSRELIKSIELIIGHQKTVEALTLEEGDDVNKLREEVEKKTEELDQGEGVLVLVDLLGGSPWNVSSICTKKEAVECVAGLNMPMLLEAIESRETCALQELKQICMKAAVEGVVSARELFFGCSEDSED